MPKRYSVPWRIVYISFFLSDSSVEMIYIALKMGLSRQAAPLQARDGEIPVLYDGYLVEDKPYEKFCSSIHVVSSAV
jgi:hypothetical protein